MLVKLEGEGAEIRDFWEKSKGLADDSWEFSNEYSEWATEERTGNGVRRSAVLRSARNSHGFAADWDSASPAIMPTIC